MNNTTYLEQVIEDVRNYIENEINLQDEILTGEFDDRDDIEEKLNDALWIDDSITGNASGSYTFNSEEAKRNVLADIDTVREALREFCVDAETIADKFLNEEWEYLDVTTRCYVLGQAIGEVLDEKEEEIDFYIEKRENNIW